MVKNSSKKFLLWTLVFLTASVLLSFSHYQSSSNDSKYYSALVSRYYDKNWNAILTPKWGENYWGFDPQSYMRDQLPGQIVMGSLLAKVGIPAQHALHILEMAFLLGAIFLIKKCVSIFADQNDDEFILYALMMIPLSFSYNLRANHEAGIFFFSALALYSGLRLHAHILFAVGAIISCLFLMWIKGPFVIFGFILFAWGAWLSREKSNLLKPITVLFAAGLMVLGCGLVYEKFFVASTSEEFFAVFWRIQIEERAMNIATHSFVIQKILNFKYYFLKYLAYSLPWSLTALVLVLTTNRSSLKKFITSPISVCLLGASLAYLGVFSMSERVAGRYAFPGYYFFSAWLALLCYHQSKHLQRFQKKLGSLSAHYLAAGLWLMAFGLHFITN